MTMQEYRVAIVTNSPSLYAKKVLRHFNIPYDTLIGYHDVKKRKPHPEPMQFALEKLGVEGLPAQDSQDDIPLATARPAPLVDAERTRRSGRASPSLRYGCVC